MYVVGDGPTGVLVLSGSSGRVEEDRCRVLAGLGATAASYRWFGETVDRVPLESFDDALSTLHERCERLVVLGTSRGAEAALLLGARHAEIDAVVAVSPQRRRLGGAEPGPAAALVVDQRRRSRCRSCRTTTTGSRTPTRSSSWACTSRASRRTPTGCRPRGSRSSGSRVRCCWSRAATTGSGRPATSPSGSSDRRSAAGLRTELVSHPRAGHRVVLPGEQPPAASHLVHGGTADADAALGAAGVAAPRGAAGLMPVEVTG